LVPDDDVLVFNNPGAETVSATSVSSLNSLATFSLGLASLNSGFEIAGSTGDKADLGADLQVLDEIELIGMTSETGLSHDLYV
jgi:hypothetical protein